MPDVSVLRALHEQLTPQQWKLLLKAGLCLGCQLALSSAANIGPDDAEEDYGRPFPEERL